MSAKASLPILLLVFLTLGFFVSQATPYRQEGKMRYQRGADGQPLIIADIGAPDERQHATYIAHLLEGKGFPVLKPGDPNLYESYQSHQPPLYYVLASGWCRALGLDPTRAEDGAKLRWLNTLFGAGTLAMVFFAGLWGFGRWEVGFAGATLLGLMPMNLALNSAVSNDPLVMLLVSTGIAVMIRLIRFGWTLPLAALLGVILGLALLTKTIALALLIALALVAGLRMGKATKAWWRWLPLLLGLLMVLPWWMRNQSLYGDLLGLGAFKEAFVGTAQRKDLIAMLATQHGDAAASVYWTQWFGWWTLRSFFGAFGQMDIFWEPVWYGVGSIAVAILAFGWARAQRGFEKGSVERSVTLLCGVLFGVVIAQFIQFNLTYFQAQARYLYPAFVPLALGLGLGWVTLTKANRWALLGTLALMIVVNAANLAYLKEQFALRIAL